MTKKFFSTGSYVHDLKILFPSLLVCQNKLECLSFSHFKYETRVDKGSLLAQFITELDTTVR